MGGRRKVFTPGFFQGYSLLIALFVFALISLLTSISLAITSQDYLLAVHQRNQILAGEAADCGLTFGKALLENKSSSFNEAPVFLTRSNHVCLFQLNYDPDSRVLSSTGIVEEPHGKTLAQVQEKVRVRTHENF